MKARAVLACLVLLVAGAAVAVTGPVLKLVDLNARLEHHPN